MARFPQRQSLFPSVFLIGEGNYFSSVNKIFAPPNVVSGQMSHIVAAGNYFWPGFTTLRRISRYVHKYLRHSAKVWEMQVQLSLGKQI